MYGQKARFVSIRQYVVIIRKQRVATGVMVKMQSFIYEARYPLELKYCSSCQRSDWEAKAWKLKEKLKAPRRARGCVGVAVEQRRRVTLQPDILVMYALPFAANIPCPFQAQV